MVLRLTAVLLLFAMTYSMETVAPLGRGLPVAPDVARIYYAEAGDASASIPPAPAAPVAPIPGIASIDCAFQLMREISTAHHIDDYNRTGSYICSPGTAAAKAGPGAGQLLAFFTGTAPSDNTLFIQTAAALGFHAVGRPCLAPVCLRNYF